ncbi:hypothetical protein NLG97_g8953 [Lecanicillium saksenae]|uniref:Uncharacterized protein n=1 Tax=Lecanicillium saksenae TaxID=468837 RepID=A0ACC1QJ85_9HYPO|nr:hypothetical protein NLG97_g8953 [Lecanicillium saksenae]
MYQKLTFFLLQNVGKCKPKAALEEAEIEETEVEERDLEARCLANGKACKSNGSMGNCCSGFCLAQGSKVGKCQKH